MVFYTSLLNTHHNKVRIKSKWSNRKKGLALSPTPRYSSYLKGSLRVVFDNGRPSYFVLLLIAINFHSLGFPFLPGPNHLMSNFLKLSLEVFMYFSFIIFFFTVFLWVNSGDIAVIGCGKQFYIVFYYR